MGTERDILINFLLGLRSDFFDALINNENLQTLEAFFVEAVVLEATLNVKVESHFVESNYDEPTMSKFENIKNETEVPIEPEVLLVQKSEFGMNYQDNDYFPDEYVINDDQANYDGFNGEEEAMETDDKKSLKTPKTVKKSPKKRRPSRSTPKMIGHSTTYYESDNEDKEDPDFHEDDSDFEEPDDSDDDFD